MSSGSFSEFTVLVKKLGNETAHNEKTAIFSRFVKTFHGDLYLLVKLILPKEDNRVYNVKSKQLCKIFSNVLNCPLDAMIKDLSKGEVSDTCSSFFAHYGHPQPTSSLTLSQVDAYLDSLTKLTKEAEQESFWKGIFRVATEEDIRFMVRLVVKDLRHYTGSKFVLQGLHPRAYEAYRHQHNLQVLVQRYQDGDLDNTVGSGGTNDHEVLIAMKPMLARPCKSLDEALNRCPGGMQSEIKYDGERIQIHKDDNKFKFYSRNLKVMPEKKIAEVRNFIPQAFPNVSSLVADGEILLMSKKGEPLPFGTLGVHKKRAFKDATVCVIIFDIMHLNGKSVMSTPLRKRRELLASIITEIPGRVVLSEALQVQDPDDLTEMMNTVLAKKLEGLVVKDLTGVYEPNARHWLKIKKDYLAGMADSADLVVLGAYYGTGSKGGIMSIFLMGVRDNATNTFKTVCKLGNGHDDETLLRLQQELDMIPIQKDKSRVPTWLDVSSSYVPDFVVKDPYSAPVWEIAGAEFSESPAHTANKISIRFPRITRMRSDKDITTATDLATLERLVEASKETADVKVPNGASPVKAKRKTPSVTLKRKKESLQPSILDAFKASPQRPTKKARIADTADTSAGHCEPAPPVTVSPIKKCNVMLSSGNLLEPPKSPAKKCILHFVDDSSRWFNRGTGRSLAMSWPKVSAEYEKSNPALGDVISVVVGAGITVALLVVYDSSSRTRPPVVELDSLDRALKIILCEGSSSTSFHIAEETCKQVPSDDWYSLGTLWSHSLVRTVQSQDNGAASESAPIDLAGSSTDSRDSDVELLTNSDLPRPARCLSSIAILPDLLEGKSYALDATTLGPQLNKLRRYILAFGGDVVPVDTLDQVDYFVTTKNQTGSIPSTCTVIQPSDVWDSIRSDA